MASRRLSSWRWMVRTCRFLVVLDHHGSGHEARTASDLESDILDALERAGVPRERTAAIAFEPELEIALLPVWTRVLEILAAKRGLLPKGIDASDHDPKASWAAALRAYQLKTSPALFAELARELSLENLKMGSALGKLAKLLELWFGANSNR
jgi:hypothetical protein